MLKNNHISPTLMDKSPCLIPWDLNKGNLKLFTDETMYHWKAIDSCGTCALIDEDDNWYAIVSVYYYILVDQNNRSFLLWKRGLEKINGTQRIQLLYYEVDKLQPIAGKDKILSRLKTMGTSFSVEFIQNEKIESLFTVDPTIKFEFTYIPRKNAMKFDFPLEFKNFKEFILITELENLYECAASNWYNTTMLLINTESGWIINYPQDWFNKSNYDFEYQGITRAVKNPETTYIHGQGIRLPDFVLDMTNKQLLKCLNET